MAARPARPAATETPRIEDTMLKAPDALAAVVLVVALAAPEPVLEAVTLAIVMEDAPVAAAGAAEVVATAAVVATPAATLAPAISLSMVALKVPVIPVRVSLAENAVKGN